MEGVVVEESTRDKAQSKEDITLWKIIGHKPFQNGYSGLDYIKLETRQFQPHLITLSFLTIFMILYYNLLISEQK